MYEYVSDEESNVERGCNKRAKIKPLWDKCGVGSAKPGLQFTYGNHV